MPKLEDVIDAQLQGIKIIEQMGGNGTAVVAALAKHNPPILLCYPHEMKDDGVEEET